MDNHGTYEIPSEATNPRTRDIDLLPSDEVVSLLNAEDQQVPLAVASVLPELSRGVELVINRLRSGGKAHYFRVGTSGRIAMADAAELPPTYGVEADLFVVHQAGGPGPNTVAIEHAEDDAAAGADAAMGLSDRDAAIGIAASGLTPFVVGALRRAKQRAAATNTKLDNRALPILREATDLDQERCNSALDAADGELGTALTMLLAGAEATEARDALERNDNPVRAAVRELARV